MKLCPNCGAQLNDEEQFCHICGTKTSQENSQQPTGNVNPNVQQPNMGGYQQPVNTTFQQHNDNIGGYNQTNQNYQNSNSNSTPYTQNGYVGESQFSVGYFLIGFMIPLAGFIVAACTWNSNHRAGKSALIGACVSMALAFLFTLVVGVPSY